jgi:hypothetical protein
MKEKKQKINATYKGARESFKKAQKLQSRSKARKSSSLESMQKDSRYL